MLTPWGQTRSLNSRVSDKWEFDGNIHLEIFFTVM